MIPCIIYATKNGATKKIAEMISEKLGGCDIFNIENDTFDLSKYDTVIIGSNIRMGTVNKNISRLMLQFIKPLTQLERAFFLSCAFIENEAGYFERNVPPQLLKGSVAAMALGGELDKKKLKGVDKMVANMVTKADKEKNTHRIIALDKDRIEQFVDKILA